MSTGGYVCSRCGQRHEDLPFDYHVPAPAYWVPDLDADDDTILGEDQCVIQGKHFFARGLIRIPVVDSELDFHWGVWVSLSKESFLRMSDLWESEGRESEPPYSGWLSTELPVYSESTLNLRTKLHTQPVGERPLVELEPTDHPLAVEQREGITVARVQELAEELLHAPG